MKAIGSLAVVLVASLSFAQTRHLDEAKQIRERGMAGRGAYRLLHSLTSEVGHRLSGSPGMDKAVEWGKRTMESLGFQNVRLMPCMVPRWERGEHESLTLIAANGHEPLSATALGGSIATPPEGIEAEVVVASSLQAVADLGERAKGKIVLINAPMDPTLTDTFAAYGRAVGARSGGAIAAAKVGALAVLVRSMTLDPDDEPHTGGMRYDAGVTKIPSAAVGIRTAERLSALAARGNNPKVRLVLSCRTLPDAPSANVIGELVGTQKPNEVIVIGGHLDSWDKGTGAHDDGAGIAHSLEALRILKSLGWKPKRTIRCVLFTNEENGGRGGAAYAEYAKTAKEKHVAAIESDSGGFAPRGFSSSGTEAQTKRLERWLPALSEFEIDYFEPGGSGGADIAPLRTLGTMLFGFQPEGQRYFDYHHSNKDTIDKVNARELQLGACAMALLLWMLSEEGAPSVKPRP